MPGGYWPVIKREELFAGKDATASVIRRMAQQALFDRRNGTAVLASWGSSQDYPDTGPALNNVSDTPDITLGYFVTPGGLGFPAIKVIVRYDVDGGSADTGDFVYVKFQEVGGAREYRAVISKVGGFHQTTTVEIPAVAEGTIWKVVASLADPDSLFDDVCTVQSISAYWRPPTAAELGLASLPSKDWLPVETTSFFAAGRSLTAAVLQRLWQNLIRQRVYRPRPAFHHSFRKSYIEDSGETYTRVFSGQMYIPAGTTSVAFSWGILARTYNTNWKIVVGADTAVEQTNVASSSAEQERAAAWAVPTAMDATEQAVEVWARATIGVPSGKAHLVYFSANSEPVAPPGVTVPASFPSIALERIISGRGIFAADDVDSEQAGLKYIAEAVNHNERYHQSRGMLADHCYRWLPFGARSADTDPAAYSIAGPNDTTQLLPYDIPGDADNSFAARFHRSHFLGCCGLAVQDTTAYRYRAGISLGDISKYASGAPPAEIRAKIVHGSWTSDEFGVGRPVSGTITIERPSTSWTEEIDSTTDPGTLAQNVRLDLWKESRGGDTVPYVAGLLVIGKENDL